MFENVQELLADHSLILAAWKRVQLWYTVDDLRPEPEFTDWQLQPEEHLLELSNAFAAGTYQPSVFNLIPFPKSGAILRHFSVPTVRDQVAFTCFAVLLAPALDSKMANFSFGNRWYRGVYLENGSQTWRFRSFSQTDTAIFQPNRRAHNLYRRVSHWTAVNMLRGEQDSFVEAGDKPDNFEYPLSMLPPFIQKEWWLDSDSYQGFWCQLDLQLAYPSVEISVLRERLISLLRLTSVSEEDDFYREKFCPEMNSNNYENYDGYSSQIRLSISTKPHLLEELVQLLCDLLGKVEYLSPIKNDFWLPPHVTNRLPRMGENHPGLPTGLLISGLLLNCYLDPLDRNMSKWMKHNSNGAAFIRYADDILLLAPSEESVLAGIDMVWAGITNSSNSYLGAPQQDNPSNMRFNWAKVAPPPIAKLAEQYLKDHGISKCECGHFKQDSSAQHISTLSDWWKSQSPENRNSLFNASEASISRQRLGPFVTFLVERLSDIGNNDIGERFGERARERMTELHSLIREHRTDRQVKADTRLLFAAHRLAKAWLPDESPEAARRDIAAIRTSLKEAIFQAPWKFQLWGAILKAASRRPPGAGNATDDKSATAWLQSILEVIGYSAGPPGRWLTNWPEGEMGKQCRLQVTGDVGGADTWKEYYLSFLRTYFWRSLADVLRTLRATSDSLESSMDLLSADVGSAWSSSSWVFRTLDETDLPKVVAWLSQLDLWFKCLYGDEDFSKLVLFTWELDAICLASLAIQSRIETLGDAIRIDASPLKYSGSLDRKLALPAVKMANAQRVFGFLNYHDRILHSHEIAAWSTVALSGRSRRQDRNIAKMIVDSSLDLDAQLAIGQRLGISNAYSEGFLNSLSDAASPSPSAKSGLLRLSFYRRRRMAYLSIPRLCNSGTLSIQRLLWGAAWSSPNPLTWTLAYCHSPAIGLPVLPALGMFRTVLKNVIERDRSAETVRPQTWLVSKVAVETLAHGRRIQLELEPASRLDETFSTDCTEDNFEKENLPHPAYFLPIVLGLATGMSKKYRSWCAFLNFISVVDGCEITLDSFLEHGLGIVPFEERLDLRTRVHLPLEIWKALDKIRDWFASTVDWNDTTQTGQSHSLNNFSTVDFEIQSMLQTIGKTIDDTKFTVREFRWQRTDTLLLVQNQIELPQSIALWKDDLKPELIAQRSELSNDMLVRVGQVHCDIDWHTGYIDRLLRLTRHQILNSLRQILECFYSEGQTMHRLSTDLPKKPALIIFPEVTLPISEASTFLKAVRDTGISGIVGTHFQILTPKFLTNINAPPPHVLLSNRALVVIYLKTLNRTEHVITRRFDIVKPNPTHQELALAELLSTSKTAFKFQRGSHWYRFIHPDWGDFSVAICSDLLDPSPWRSMQGQLLHLFMCAHNEDVNLFEHLTWIRAYENYVNVVSTNHGSKGGSFAWSPRTNHARELLSLKGKSIFSFADFNLPVVKLFDRQITGPADDLARSIMEWWEPDTKRSAHFKATPPGFKTRKI